jgi:ABC-2 type transport system ATP-binding protein
MKQKVALARALLHRPQVLFLDEPTAGLDPVAAVSLRNDLLELARREGVTVFLTTHNLDEAERVCDRVGVIRGGRLVAEGTPGELRAGRGRPTVTITGSGFDGAGRALLARPEVATVDVGDGVLHVELTGEVPVAPLVRLIVERGGAVEEVRKGAASLEDAFLALLSDEVGS